MGITIKRRENTMNKTQTMSHYAETWRRAADMWWREYEAQKKRAEKLMEENIELRAEVERLKATK